MLLSHHAEHGLEERRVQRLMPAPTAGWVSMGGCEPPNRQLCPADAGLSAGEAPYIGVSHPQAMALLTDTGASLSEFPARGISLF